MSIYYVDLSLNSNPGYLVNNPAQPMGWAEFQPFYIFGALSIIHEMRIKGSRDATGQSKLTGGLLLKAWDLALYGPWRLKLDSIGNNSGGLSNEVWQIQDAIIDTQYFRQFAGTSPSTSLTINNVFLQCSYFQLTSALSAAINLTINGTTIKVIGQFQTGSFTKVITVKDSVIDSTNRLIGTSGSYSNCVFNLSNSFSPMTMNNCQFSWTPPTWPAWNAQKSAFASTIATGINTPPQPGNSPYTGYSSDLFGNPRQGIGGFYWAVFKLLVSQRTNRHVVKSFSLPTIGQPAFSNNFGTFGVSGNDSSHLSSPWGITTDLSNYIYVCDHNNQRILKLTSDLQFVASLDVSSTVRYPCCIYFDSSSGDLYVAGINYHIIEGDALYMYINIARYTTNLTLVKFTWDTLGINQRLERNQGEIAYKPMAIAKGQLANEFYIVGIRDKIYSTIELSTGFDVLQEKLYYNELPTRFNGLILHSNGYYYLNNGRSILKFDSTLNNISDSSVLNKIFDDSALGPSIVSNGAFDIDTSGWLVDGAATITWNSAKADVKGLQSTSPLDRVRKIVTTVLGRRYKFSIKISGINSGTASVSLQLSNLKVGGGDQTIAITSNGTYTIEVEGGSGTNAIEIRVVSSGTEKTFTIDDVKLQQIMSRQFAPIVGSIFGLKQISSGNIWTYNSKQQSILEYDQNLNFVKEIYRDSGSTLQTDLYDVFDMIQIMT